MNVGVSSNPVPRRISVAPMMDWTERAETSVRIKRLRQCARAHLPYVARPESFYYPIRQYPSSAAQSLPIEVDGDDVQAMIKRGISDPRRVCIAGIYYGGCAALAGAAFTPKLYACAASVNRVSDLRALLEAKFPTSEPGEYRVVSTAMSAWKQRIGSPSDSALDKKSPINSIASIAAPILMIYGKDDGVVPNAQFERMAQALRRDSELRLSNFPGKTNGCLAAVHASRC
jgi:hypothetical protein